MQSKVRLRERFLSERKNTEQHIKREIDEKIAENIISHPWFQNAGTVFVYYSTDEEISTQPIIKACLEMGKRVCLPKCLAKRQMQAMAITDTAQLTGSYFGIPEPDEKCPIVEPKDIDLCLVPAMACDRRGFRLGYGGGFYDRFLPKTDAKKLVLCASSRVIDRLPTDGFDISCDGIVTEQEVIYP